MRTVIIGGTGTLGKELTRQILARDPGADIVCFSRGELAQQSMKAEFPSVRYVIGDVRDREAVKNAVRGAWTVFHLAAIKHVDVAQQNPLEALKTNALGTVNVAEESIAAGVPFVVFSNTDKAVLSITTYGHTKAWAQDYVLSLNGTCRTKFSAFLWGNIAASRGSVLPIFAKTLDESAKAYITDMAMSRFWLTIDQAASFMLDNYMSAYAHKAMIPPVKGATVLRVAAAVARVKGIKDFDVEVTGIRGVEKIHEVLESTHERCLRSDTCEQYSDDELDELVRRAI